MASGWTNRGKYAILGDYFRAVASPTVFYLYLADDTTTPTVDHNTKADLTELPNGNGYTTGGKSIARDAVSWDVYTEDDTADDAYIQLEDQVWTASGGNLPLSGNGARWAVLTDDNGTDASRILIAWWDLVANRIVSDTQTLTLQDCELKIS